MNGKSGESALLQVLDMARSTASSDVQGNMLKLKISQLLAQPESDQAVKAFKHGQGTWEVTFGNSDSYC